MIELRNVSKSFGESKQSVEALRKVSVSIQDGEIVGIIGYSGAGKSTLLRLLNGLTSPTSGEVLVDGVNPSTLKGAERIRFRQQFGMIFQHFHLLWSRSVNDNVRLALELANVPKNEQDQRIAELLGWVGLTDKAHQYPATLSGGEKQRVGIARALANRPRYLLCDEATSALDPETTRSILDLLQRIHRDLGVTIVLITHQMEVIQAIAERVLVMEGGEIVESNDLLPLLLNPQQEITRKFVKSIVDPGERISWEHDMVYRLSYVDTLSSRPLISEIIQRYGVEVNILQGKISRTGQSSYGTLYVTLQGAHQKEALAFLQEQGVRVGVES
jgi:D-methionine transport system ATP-binding protein